MWASCCGLLNEVMGTGTVRAQQPGFGAGAGPFRFAPSAGYSTYPPTSSGSAGQLCKACGLAFSVFRRKVRVHDSDGTSRPKTSFLHTTFTSALQTLRACLSQLFSVSLIYLFLAVSKLCNVSVQLLSFFKQNTLNHNCWPSIKFPFLIKLWSKLAVTEFVGKKYI